MRNPVTATTTPTDESRALTARLTAFDESRALTARLTAFDESRGSAGLFTEPVDVSVLRDLQVDEHGRRWHWVPADCLL
jgi:hypothetical protein